MGILKSACLVCAMAMLAHAQPVFRFQPDTLNFGHITPRAFVMGSVDVYNSGSDTLVIRNIETSCGCTSATPDATRIAFMETATIRMSMNIERKKGRVAEWVRISSNDPVTPERSVWMIVDIDSVPNTSISK